MLLDKDMSIAVKNLFGQYDIKKFTLFDVEKINNNFPSLEVKINKNKEFILKLTCPLCGDEHIYTYGINELVKRDVVIGGCEILGLPLFYMGNASKVEQHVKRHNDISRQMYVMI